MVRSPRVTGCAGSGADSPSARAAPAMARAMQRGFIASFYRGRAAGPLTLARAGRLIARPTRPPQVGGRPEEDSCDIPFRRSLARCFVVALAVCGNALAQQPITLHGAVQFNDDHAFTKALVRFEELVKKYYGKPINFVLHKNSELGLEKDYFAFMNQGISVDYGIVSPAHMSTFSQGGPVHRCAVPVPRPRSLEQGARRRHAEAGRRRGVAEGRRHADRLRGGGTRNIFANKPVHNMAELKGLKIRVQGAPIWSKTFAAAGMAPT
jgi:TRAP-type C4-dicarboxylate transport system substrate-binding protein